MKPATAAFNDFSEHLSEMNPGALLADGFEDALIGYVRRFGLESLALYDYEKCIGILMKRDGMGRDEAEEFFEFNVIGAWVGDATPVFARLLPPGTEMTETLKKSDLAEQNTEESS